MLELDTWLAALLDADFNDDETVDAIESLLGCEPPQLQAMMQGDLEVPAALAGWLPCR